jgi:hypothetical protein
LFFAAFAASTLRVADPRFYNQSLLASLHFHNLIKIKSHAAFTDIRAARIGVADFMPPYIIISRLPGGISKGSDGDIVGAVDNIQDHKRERVTHGIRAHGRGVFVLFI